MDDRQRWRLEQLQKEACSIELAEELFGLDLRHDNALLGRFRAWASRFWRGEPVVRSTSINRHALESFFQFSGLVPVKWAAAEVGMEQSSFVATLQALQGDGLPVPMSSISSEQVVEERLVRDLHKWFPALSHVLFVNHSAYCARLHEVIEGTYPFIKVGALRCVTSEALGEDPPDYADTFDVLTLDPVGLRYQVWLDFKKPVNLRPDCCSLKFYASEQAALSSYVMRGGEPAEIPATLLARPA